MKRCLSRLGQTRFAPICINVFLMVTELRVIACDNPKRPGVQQLWQVRALLECTGALDDGNNGNGSAQPATSSKPDIQTVPESERTIVSFDATTRRRDKMRRAAMSSRVPRNATTADFECRLAPSSSHAATTTPQFDLTTNLQRPTAAPEAAAAPAAVSSTTSSADDISQLETFLISFVVEQTGYPPDVVELEADLEADLGIDSIKKVQLFDRAATLFRSAGGRGLDAGRLSHATPCGRFPQRCADQAIL